MEKIANYLGLAINVALIIGLALIPSGHHAFNWLEATVLFDIIGELTHWALEDETLYAIWALVVAMGAYPAWKLRHHTARAIMKAGNVAHKAHDAI